MALERTGSMRVPGIVFASAAIASAIEPEVLRQVSNVASLPGIVEASFAMPDVHWGYGFPIGGVAATDAGAGGVVSPGGVGFDISCGVRLLLSRMTVPELGDRRADLMDGLATAVPVGLGRGGVWPVHSGGDLERILRDGARAAVTVGLGEESDLLRCEDHGRLAGAGLSQVSERAMARGLAQVGSLGSGNHFLEVQEVERIYDEPAARAFGLFESQICVMIHSGSRGLGHQICSDHVRAMRSAMGRYSISVPDLQLACAPVESPEGQAYLGAMAAANLAKLERHRIADREVLLCVHRKGATLALPPGHPDLSDDFRSVGQPVLVPGSMGTGSWVLTGASPGGAFHSACHGAGRTMSRHAAARRTSGHELRRRLEQSGISVRAASDRGLAEEDPDAYKDVDEVVGSCLRSGLANPVARLRPVGVRKG